VRLNAKDLAVKAVSELLGGVTSVALSPAGEHGLRPLRQSVEAPAPPLPPNPEKTRKPQKTHQNHFGAAPKIDTEDTATAAAPSGITR